jgi:hypothetical protein
VDKILDTVFGQMEIRHGWQKKESGQFWDKTVNFKIKAAQYGNKAIADVQRKNYRFFLDNLSNISIKAKKAISEYMADNKETIMLGLSSNINFSPESLVIPKTAIFFADGQYGILFDCEWDKEHGLAVSLTDYKVGPQDMLL